MSKNMRQPNSAPRNAARRFATERALVPSDEFSKDNRYTVGCSMQFNLGSATDAANRGCIESWVHEYLRGAAGHEAFSDGLRLRHRSWEGPLLIPLIQLRRTCGPEPGMPFPVPIASWQQRISEIQASFVTIEAFPPLIVAYRSGELLISDGNHRLGAFTALGLEACWVIVWFPDESEKAHYDIQETLRR